jgi:hypothetical protein
VEGWPEIWTRVEVTPGADSNCVGGREGAGVVERGRVREESVTGGPEGKDCC